MYLLDTNIVVHLLNRNPLVGARISSLPETVDLYASVITEGELLAGVYRLPADQRDREREIVRGLLQDLTILPVLSDIADCYGRIRPHLKPRSRNDAWIAATAVQYDLILVTDDAEFGQVPDLVIENWAR